jgi:pimeloyl-ACP methyl ester carboxylesterase
VTRPTVVFLHGLARTSVSLVGLRRHVAAAGFPTWACSYPSRRMPIAALADEVAARIRAEVGGGELMAVTHSLGGIVLRHMAERLPWQRAVMIAPPNRGSRIALLLGHHRLFRWFYGPAGQEVARADEWPLPRWPVGVIAGTRARSLTNPVSFVAHRLAAFPQGEPNDGTVAVAETLLDGMADFLTVDANHSFILRHPVVRAAVVRFLDVGRFA